MPPRFSANCAATAASRWRRSAATWRSTTWATTRSMPERIARRWPSRAWWCCTTPCCTTFCSAGSTRRLTSRSSSTTTASGIATWRANCGGGAPPRAPTAAIFATPCCAAPWNEPAPWWCTIPPPSAPSGSTHRRRASSKSRIFSAPRHCPERPKPPATGEPWGRPRRRFSSACSATCANRSASLRFSKRLPGCGAKSREPRCWWRAASSPPTWSGPPPASFRPMASSAAPTSTSASSGSPPSAVDACLNLRYPAAGETSGIAIRLMGIGKPVVVTDSLEYARFPEDACLRVPPGVAERDSLRSHMILLTSMSGAAHAIGQRGAGHIAACHRLEFVGKRYWEVLCECCV